MSIRPSMFGGSTGNQRAAPYTTAIGSEIDLRSEMDEILYGDGSSPAHGEPVVIRIARRDSDGRPTRCNCTIDQTTVEPEPDCSYCGGDGYLWDESWAWAFVMYAGADSGLVRRFQRMSPGEVRVDYKVFYFRYDTVVLYGDKIVQPVLDIEGNLELPYRRLAVYKPQTIQKRRSDGGRVEYVAVYCREDDAIRTDNPQ